MSSDTSLKSVRSFFVLSETSAADHDWFSAWASSLGHEGWLINRTRWRSDGSMNVYIRRPGHRGY